MAENKKIAFIREIEATKQCELNFLLDVNIKDVGSLQEEITAVRQITDTIASLLQHIKNKIGKIMRDKLDLSDEEDNENLKINVSIKRKNKSVKHDTILKNIFKQNNENLILKIYDQTFSLIVNAPAVKLIKLPEVIYVGFCIQPASFKALFADRNSSVFIWFKSLDKQVWKRIGKDYNYLVKDEDVEHFLKLVCIPHNKVKLRGPSAETISETKVEPIGELPTCPFENRHNFTRKPLIGNQFRVVSYNILSERYTDNDQFPYCSPRARAMDYRKQLILKELVGYNADIICLQEVDNRHYTKYFKEQFKHLDYSSMFHRKGNRIPEGLACIYNKNRFKCVPHLEDGALFMTLIFRQISSQQIVISEAIQERKMFAYLWSVVKRNEELKQLLLKQSTSLQITVLKSKEYNSLVIVGNTHLYYHPDCNHIRLVQINVITTFIDMLKKRLVREGEEVSVIICGDFNSNPESSIYSYMCEGKIHHEHKDCLKIEKNGKSVLYHNFYFMSACGTPKYTNFTNDFKGCLDYIFIEGNILKVVNVVPMTEESELCKYEGLPNELFPSDHLALVADISFSSILGC